MVYHRVNHDYADDNPGINGSITAVRQSLFKRNLERTTFQPNSDLRLRKGGLEAPWPFDPQAVERTPETLKPYP